MERTVDRIVAASKLPLSIVIVGVGGADFSNMVHRGLIASNMVHMRLITIWYTFTYFMMQNHMIHT